MPHNAFIAIKAACITVIVSMTLYLLYNSGQTLERQFNPVVGPLTITRSEIVDLDHTRIWVQFEKLRECRPIEVYWYQGTRTGLFERVQFVVEKPLGTKHYVNRPVGIQKAGPWIISVPFSDIPDRVFADAQHSCNPAWDSISRFYN